MIMLLRGCAAVLIPCALMAQAPQMPRFEVASVKRSEQLVGRGNATASTDPGRISYTNTPLKSLLMRAYGVKRDRVLGPDWLDTEQYHVSAKFPDGAREDQIPAMLQNLLAERFQMTVRRETKAQAAYVLTAGKDGPKLKSTADPELAATGAKWSLREGGGVVTYSAKGVSLTGLADFLTSALRRPVFDMTGLKGYFDCDLEIDARDNAGSLLRLIPRLGLKLESRDMPVEYIVVEKAEKVPTEN